MTFVSHTRRLCTNARKTESNDAARPTNIVIRAPCTRRERSGDHFAAGTTDAGGRRTLQAPALLLKKILELPANSVAFFVVPKNDMVEDAAVIQGLANLRNEFKANKRTLVLLGRDVKLPSFLSEPEYTRR